MSSYRNMYDQPPSQTDLFPGDSAPFQHYARALRFGTGSREWNLYLASLAPTDRVTVVKASRANVYKAPDCYHPRPKSYPRGQTASSSSKGG